jgi:putative endonuclease
MDKPGFVYIMASGRNGTIYLGVTSDLLKRVWEHRNGIVAGFTKKYGWHRLVWYEAYDGIEEARQRELQMKEWKRAWKVKQIEGLNPEWDDLFDTLTPN